MSTSSRHPQALQTPEPVPSSTQSLLSLIGSIRDRGVQLWSSDGRLHYKAAKGQLTQEEIQKLRACKERVMALLHASKDVEATAPLASRRAPMTFSQLQHWNLYRLHSRPAIRQVTSATRLEGSLDVEALRGALAAVVRQHEALRTLIVTDGGAPEQQVSQAVDATIVVEDFTSLPNVARNEKINERADSIVLAPIDPGVGPLWAVHLLKFSPTDHVLLVAMEHMISDAHSMGLFVRDLFTGYAQAVRRQPFAFPPVPVQLGDYATAQQNHRAQWMNAHLPYWESRLHGAGRVRFPQDPDRHSNTAVGWGAVPIRISRTVRLELREWCRMTRTTMVLSVFTAYAALVMRWCNSPDAVFLFESNGRNDAAVQNTLGYLAAPMYLRLQLSQSMSLYDLLQQVTSEYCHADEHQDHSYFEAQTPRPAFTDNACFNWVPQPDAAALVELDGSQESLTRRPFTLGHPMLRDLQRDTEPFLLLYDREAEISGDIYFALNRFSVPHMQKFAAAFQAFIQALLRRAREPLTKLSLL